MSTIVSIHSYRGGTGKSNLIANLASSIVQQGKRIAVVDTDIQSPGLHVLFGMDPQNMGLTLNDYLHGLCNIEQAAYDVTSKLGPNVPGGGALYLIPSSIKASEITRVLREGYEVNLLTDGFRKLMKAFRLDYLFISPFFIIYGFFHLYPLCWAFYLSFQRWSGFGDMNLSAWTITERC